MSYIVKEDLLEELGISTDCSTCPRYDGECRGHLSWLCGKIDRMPTHDVVRCKDCKHRDPEDHKCDSGALERAGCIFPVQDDYFCAWGERREDG